MITLRIPVAVATMLVWLGGPQTAWSQSDEWRTNGPVAGIINAVAVDPQVPTTIYAGTDQSGVFKSNDSGDSWFAVNNGLPGLRIFALAIDSQVTSTLYAVVLGSGIFKSLDGGGSWSATGGGLTPSTTQAIQALAIDPQNPTTLYVGTNGDNIFKTTDGGMSWSRSGPSNTQAFAIDPQTPTTLYAGTDLRVFKSTDGGASWIPLETGLRATWVRSLAIDPVDPRTVYLSNRPYESAPPYHRLLKSTDGGATWNDPAPGLSDGSLHTVVIDPKTPSTLYARGSYGVFRSRDGGANWSAMNEGLTDLVVTSLAVDRDATTLYAGTSSGVFVRPLRPPSFLLSVDRSGDGEGAVTSGPSGIDCGTDCFESYPRGTTVTLNAAPAAGSVFVGWTGCETVDGASCVVTMAAESSVTARFDRQRFTLTVSTPGIGRGTVTSSPSGIDCGADCAEAFVGGAAVTLRAMPALGSIFTGWSGCDAVSGKQCTVVMSRGRSVSASFLGLSLGIGLRATGATGALVRRTSK